VRRILVGMCAILVAVLATHAQNVGFEVASVKRAHPVPDAEGLTSSGVETPSPGRLEARNCNLVELIEFAYSTKDYLVSGPEWIRSKEPTFDISAKAPPDTPKRVVRRMLQSLLADRFELVIRHETKVMPIYELVVAKGGAKLSKPNSTTEPEGWTFSQGGRVTGHKVDMKGLADRLTREIGRPVIDMTGVQETFDFTLEFSNGGENDPRPPILTAVQEQLGLKLNAAQHPVPILVIDHASKVAKEN